MRLPSSGRPTAVVWPAHGSVRLRAASGVVSVLRADRRCDVIPVLEEVEARTRRGCHAIGWLAYEAGPAFDPALVCAARKPGFPLAWFCVCRELMPLSADPAPSEPFSIGPWRPNVSRRRYLADLRRIRTLLRNGDTYQVNYSFRLLARFSGCALSWFRARTRSTPHAYAAFVQDAGFSIASYSPELFFTLDGCRLRSRPMKGTAPRGRWREEDDAFRAALAASPKNRAENVMITDMVRNDLGRVARAGTVAVPNLFRVEPHPTVLQMTSTVECTTDASLAELLRALFPPASVTGAPKPRTMRIIRDLERVPRGIYTGAIGVLSPGRRWEFSVAIRTAHVDRRAGLAEYGIGGGIVWDSEPAAEYAECLSKARILSHSGSDRPAHLLETIRYSGAGRRFHLLTEHLDRIAYSAGVLGFRFDRRTAARRLAADAEGRGRARDWRVRLLLEPTGRMVTEWHELPAPARTRLLRVAKAPRPVDSRDPRLYHKTDARQLYDAAKAAVPHADDVLLWNEKGELTEASSSNVVVKLRDGFVTPPVACGLLPGTFRRRLIEQRKVREAVIRMADLRAGQRLFLVNSVRGWRPARFIG